MPAAILLDGHVLVRITVYVDLDAIHYLFLAREVVVGALIGVVVDLWLGWALQNGLNVRYPCLLL